MAVSDPYRPWRFRPDLRQLELRDMPGSLLDFLLPDALGAGPARLPAVGPQFHTTTRPAARPPAFGDEFFAGPVLPDETPTTRSQPKGSAGAEDSSARRKSNLDDLLPDWLTRVSVAPTRFAHWPEPTPRREPSVGGPVEFTTVPNFRGSMAAPAMSVVGDEETVARSMGTYSYSMMMSGPPPATVNAYDPAASELTGGTTGLFEFVRDDSTSGDLEVTFHIEQGPDQATYAADYDLWNEGVPVPVGAGTVGGLTGLFGVVTIPSAQPSTTVKVDVFDDLDVEGPEAVDVTVVRVAGVDLASGDQTHAFVSIADNDPTDDLSQRVWVARVDATAQENYESTDQWNTGKVELRRSVAAGMLNVNYATGGTAALDSDYALYGPVATGYYDQINANTKLGAAGKVTFADGQDRLWVRVNPLWSGGATAFETAEFTVAAGSGYEVGAPDLATVGVYGDRPPGHGMQPDPYGDYSHSPLLDVFITTGPDGGYIGDASAAEAGGDPGAILISYLYQTEDPGFVPPDPPDPMWVLGGTAKEGEDYTATVTRVVTARTEQVIERTSAPTVYRISGLDRIEVDSVDDSEEEGEETVDIAVPRSAADDGGLIGIAQVTLADNDANAVPTVRVEAPDSVSTEWQLSTGSYWFVRDETKLAYPLTVSYEFGGSAKYGDDYTVATTAGSLPSSGTVAFAAGQKAVEVKLTPLTDEIEENHEVAELALSYAAEYGVLVSARRANVQVKDKADTPKIEIIDSAKRQTTKLRVAKWQNAFGPLNENGIREVKNNFIDLDPDRFYVRVTDKGKIGAGTITISYPDMWTDRDSSTGLILYEYAGQPGVFESKSLMLMSNRTDDEWQVDQVPDGQAGDRTYLVKLGDRFHVEYARPGINRVTAEARVPVERIVQLQVTIVRNSAGGAAPYTEAEAQGDVERAGEQLAQIGIELRAKYQTVNPPQNLDLSNGLDITTGVGAGGKMNLSDEQELLLGSDLRTPQMVNPHNLNVYHDIEIFYVNHFTGANNTYGVSYVPSLMPQTIPGNAITMNSLNRNQGAYDFVVPHEIGHVLSDDYKYPVTLLARLISGTTGVISWMLISCSLEARGLTCMILLSARANGLLRRNIR